MTAGSPEYTPFCDASNSNVWDRIPPLKGAVYFNFKKENKKTEHGKTWLSRVVKVKIISYIKTHASSLSHVFEVLPLIMLKVSFGQLSSARLTSYAVLSKKRY